MRPLLLMLVLGIHLTCALGQEVSHHQAAAPTQTGERVLRVVSTLIVPYLDHRKVDDPDGARGSDITTVLTDTHNPIDSTDIYLANATFPEVTTQAALSAYEGFIPDLLKVLMPYLGDYDTYDIQVVSGTKEKSSYDIMLDYLEEGKADVAAAPMTVTNTKEKRADFTYPFLKFEATIVLDESLKPRFNSLDDLVNQKEDDPENRFIRYGVRRDGAIYKFLQKSEDPLHKKMMQYFKDNNYVLQQSDDDGIIKVRWVNYAYILEGSTADWVLGQEPCTLFGIKAGFFGRQYSLAVPNQSTLRDKLNTAILKAKHQGAFEDIMKEWLKPNECVSDDGWRIHISYLSVLLNIMFAIFLR